MNSEDGAVKSITLSDGDVIDADVVIVGIGFRPATSGLVKGLRLERDMSILVDEHMKAMDSVYGGLFRASLLSA